MARQLQVIIDQAEPRIWTDRLAFLSDSRDWDFSISSGVICDGVTGTLMLAPLPFLASWYTTTAGSYTHDGTRMRNHEGGSRAVLRLQARQPFAGLHAHQVAGGYSNHRNSNQSIAACCPEGEGSGQSYELRQQPQASEVRLVDVLQAVWRVSTVAW